MLAGACVTMLPLLIVCAFARIVWKMNFIDLSVSWPEHDQSAGADFCHEPGRLRRADGRLCHGVSADHASAHLVRAVLALALCK